MKRVITIVLLVLAAGCDGPQAEANRQAEEREYQEQRADSVIQIIHSDATIFVFDGDLGACFVYYNSGGGNSAVGSLSYLPCSVAKPRLTPRHRMALEAYEAKQKAKASGKAEAELGR